VAEWEEVIIRIFGVDEVELEREVNTESAEERAWGEWRPSGHMVNR